MAHTNCGIRCYGGGSTMSPGQRSSGTVCGWERNGVGLTSARQRCLNASISVTVSNGMARLVVKERKRPTVLLFSSLWHIPVVCPPQQPTYRGDTVVYPPLSRFYLEKHTPLQMRQSLVNVHPRLHASFLPQDHFID